MKSVHPKRSIEYITKYFSIYLAKHQVFKEHAVDIASDLHIIESDILFLTKTQLTDGDCLADIHNILCDSSIIFNNNVS